MTDSRLSAEVLHVRDPDSACNIRLWVNGVEVSFDEVSVDPGAGWLRSDWDDYTATIEQPAEYSPGFKAAALEARNEWADNKYVEEA